LKRYWGFDTFRSLQQEIVESVLEDHDTLALLPTGGGKSICYQLPAMYREGLCLVISPLIALMKDQVDKLNRIGIKSYAIYTGLTNREIDIILDNCIYGAVKLLYVSPERLQTEIFIERAKKMNINLLAIDESHCISQWGYDFRPTYLQIADFRAEVIPEVTAIALTATATEKVVVDICDKLRLENHKIFKGSFERKNLAFAVRQVEQKESKLLEVLTNVQGSALVYVRHRKKTKEIVDFLNRNRISADFYHAGIGHDQRMKKQDSWKSGETRVMVATNAFGMGIDKGDVRVVVHYDVPDNLEAYYQEAGRAGRDGKKAFAVIIYRKGDRHLLNTYFENAHPDIDFLKHIYQALANYYKIAVGSNRLAFFDFDLSDFCNNFNLHSSEAYHAIRKLEEEGLLELNESFYHPSKVSVNLDKAELYKFQIANATLDPLIKTLLRLYGGELLGNFVKISEYQLARMLNTSTYKVKNQLDHLNSLKVITYDRMRDKPQLAFITNRYDASKLPLNRERLRQRKVIQREKLDAILSYVEKADQCRTAAILRYFGEHNYADCGHCDYCLEKKRRLSKSEHERIREMVHFELNKGPRLPEELTKIFSHNELPLVEEIIREMTDNDDLMYDSTGRLIWKSK
jgi:ATP-dependent DNA helicase RecQ